MNQKRKIVDLVINKGLILLALPFFSFAGFCFATEGGSVESILDRLESRLNQLENESLGFSGSSKDMFEQEDKIKVDQILQGKSMISGSTKEMDNIRAIASAINKLESEVDRLSADVQMTKQQVLQGSRIDNFVELQAKLSDGERAGIKSLSVKIDGYAIYDINESSGFWMPTGKLPLYAGPLQPGSHRVDVEVKMVLKKEGSLPLNSDIYRILNKSFTIIVPTDSFRRRWVMDVIPPENHDAQPVIKVVKSKLD